MVFRLLGISQLFKLYIYLVLFSNLQSIFACVIHDHWRETVNFLKNYPFHTRILEVLDASGTSVHISVEEEFDLLEDIKIMKAIFILEK